MAEIATLVDDIYALFDPSRHHVPNEDNLNEFAETLKEVLRTRLTVREDPKSPLRFSSLGKPDRQLWYDAHPDGSKQELSPKTYFKFLYGDVIEALLLFLAKEAGHSVEAQQASVEVDGIEGHIDAIIDGVVVDVKSASSHGMKKFVTGGILEGDDPFGYVEQLSGYASVLTPNENAAWLVMDKVSGDLVLPILPRQVIAKNPPGPRIDHLKTVLESPQPPPKCFQPVPDGKSGNMKLPVGCTYCPHLKRCWPEARKFLYSTGPRWLTTVAKTPEVYEVRDRDT